MTNEEAIKWIKQIQKVGYQDNLLNHKESLDMAIKSLEQEPFKVLDKIRAEIEAKLCDVVSDYTDGYRTAIQGDLAIIDKYKAEGSGEE